MRLVLGYTGVAEKVVTDLGLSRKQAEEIMKGCWLQLREGSQEQSCPGGRNLAQRSCPENTGKGEVCVTEEITDRKIKL